MKVIKWKTFLLTGVVCLLPILYGVLLWNKLPDVMAIHFDINNNPDNFASKGFVVFGLPCLMLVLQWFSCFVYDINAKQHGERKKFERVTKWIIPAMANILQIMTLVFALGVNVDIRRVATAIVAAVLILIGNYMPKLDYVKDYDVTTEKAREINRFIGYETVVMGILFLISVFLPPVASLVCIFLLIPYALVAVIYSIAQVKKK